MKPLTAKQEKFSQCVASGMTQADAYREAYSAENMKEDTIHNNAYKLMQNNEILTRVDELRKVTITEAVISIEKRKELLTRWVWEEETNNAMKAMEILNKMDGVYVTKSDVNVKGEVSHLFASAMEKALK